jgi:hypothetical protein
MKLVSARDFGAYSAETGNVLDGTVEIVYGNNILVEYIDVLHREKFRKTNKDLIKIVLD